jgi:hypothetical protein
MELWSHIFLRPHCRHRPLLWYTSSSSSVFFPLPSELEPTRQGTLILSMNVMPFRWRLYTFFSHILPHTKVIMLSFHTAMPPPPFFFLLSFSCPSFGVIFTTSLYPMYFRLCLPCYIRWHAHSLASTLVNKAGCTYQFLSSTSLHRYAPIFLAPFPPQKKKKKKKKKKKNWSLASLATPLLRVLWY